MFNVYGGRKIGLLVAQGATIFELLTSEDETLLVGRDALLVLDLGLDIVDSIGGLDLEGDGLSSESFNEDLHSWIGEELVEEVAVVGREMGGTPQNKGGFIRSLIQTPPAVATPWRPNRSGVTHVHWKRREGTRGHTAI